VRSVIARRYRAALFLNHLKLSNFMLTENIPGLGRQIHVIYGMNTCMKSMKTTVAERGQVTIPKALRDRLGVRPGTTLEFSEENGRLVAVKSSPTDPVAKVYGCLGQKFDTDAFMAEIRGAQR
jgi:antitoxin PrlF